MASQAILVGLDAQQLQNQGLLISAETSGYSRLHKRRLNRSSDEENAHLPLGSFDGPAPENAFATIPSHLISFQTIVYLGLTEDSACTIWDEWCKLPEDRLVQVSFLDFILDHAIPNEDVDGDNNDDEWRACLMACGTEASTIGAIMNEHFRCIRAAESCAVWLKDTIDMRYAGLLDTHRASKFRDAAIQEVPRRPGGAGPGRGGVGFAGNRGNLFFFFLLSFSQHFLTGHETKGGHPGSASSRREQSISEIQRSAEPGISSTKWTHSLATQVCNKPGQVVLFKGMDQGRLAGFWDRGTDSGDDDRKLEKLLSFPPTNFGGRYALFYFTPDPIVAEHYAAYAKSRVGVHSVVILSASISKDTMARHTEPQDTDNDDDDDNGTSLGKVYKLFYPSPKWKQLVYRSKRIRPLPKPLRKFRDALLLIGTTTKGTQRVFDAMETWEDIGEENVLRVPADNSNPAIQYVFSGSEEGQEFLLEHATFEAFPVEADMLSRTSIRGDISFFFCSLFVLLAFFVCLQPTVFVKTCLQI